MHLTRLPSWDYGSTSGEIISSVIVTKVLQMKFDYNGFVVVILQKVILLMVLKWLIFAIWIIIFQVLI